MRWIGNKMKQPNLFDYATSELSQDAIIAWLLEWGNPGCKSLDLALYECSHEIIHFLFRLHNKDCPDKIDKIEISKQSRSIDILCVINSDFAIIIEDKKGTKEHGDQLPKYIKDILGRNFQTEKIIPIYFQTHEQSHYGDVESSGYKLFSREDILPILRRHTSPNNIFLDFRAKLEELHQMFLSYLNTPLPKWYWHSWQGFYKHLQRELKLTGEVWRYVANPAGGFLGFYWFWNHDDEHGCDVYLQLEESKFCFKIGDVDSNARILARSKWFFLIQEHSLKFQLQVQKPARFGNGSYMTVAVLSNEYRAVNEDGLLDFPRTVASIRNIEAMMTSLCLKK
jgi:hypothetical protein